MTYATLQTQIADYLHRTDLTAKIPTFIALAESYLFRELHIKELQISVTGTTDASGYGTLPSDFGSVARVSITGTFSAYSLDYIALPEVSTSTSAYPKFYSLENNKLRIWGAGSGQAYTLYYIPAIQPLSASNTTNWMLDNAHDLYLYASALEGAKYVRNDNEVAKLSGALPAMLDSVKRYSERRGQPSIGSMQIKVRR